MTGLDQRLVDLFIDVVEGDEPGDFQPELHLIGLSGEEVIAVVEHFNRRGADWGDSHYYIDDEGIEVTVAERPEVAELVVSGRVSGACIRAYGTRIDDIALPMIAMFLYDEAITFFWDNGPPWRQEHVPPFFALMRELLDLAPDAKLQPDPGLLREFQQAMAIAIGRPDRISYEDA